MRADCRWHIVGIKPLQPEDIRHLVGGAGNRRVLQDGEMDAGAWSCGMVAGLIHDIPTCKELIDRIMAESEVRHRQPAAGEAAFRRVVLKPDVYWSAASTLFARSYICLRSLTCNRT